MTRAARKEERGWSIPKGKYTFAAPFMGVGSATWHGREMGDGEAEGGKEGA